MFLFKHLLDGKATVTIGSSNLRQSLDTGKKSEGPGHFWAFAIRTGNPHWV
jgi:hypothetical protein